MKKEQTEEQLALRVSVITIVQNLLLAAFKLFAGLTAHSAAMVSDAVHSASDVLSTFVVIVGVKLSNKHSDADHPYGHERMECVAALLLAAILAITGAGIGVSGVQKILSGDSSHLVVPGMLAIVAAVVSVLVKEGMYWYTRAAAKKINSGAMMADAWHHRSDALSSIGSFFGILGARMGFPVLDAIASVVIAVFIVKVSVDIFRDSIHKMTDRACDEGTTEEIRNVICTQEGVISLDLLKTRLFGNRIYVDCEISADGNITLYQAHDIAQAVHDSIEGHFPQVKHCMVHVNPAPPPLA